MDFFHLLAVFLAATANFVLGMVWYSPILFGNKWLKLTGLNEVQISNTSKSDMARLFVMSFICGTVMVLALYVLFRINEVVSISQGMFLAILLGIVVLASSLPGFLFLKKSLELWAIDFAYPSLSLLIAGVIYSILL